MKLRFYFFIFLFFLKTYPSPASIPVGGTGLTSLSTGGLLYSTSATSIAVLAIGAPGQVLKVSGGLPAWSNAFPGYIAGSNFAYGGSLSSLSASPNNTMILSTTAPSLITASAIDNTAVGYNALNAVNANTTCTAVGSGALQNCTADANTAAGYQAMYNCTTATENT